MSISTAGIRLSAIDPERWPAVATVPSGPVATVSAAIVNRLLRRAASRLPLQIGYPDGRTIGAGGPDAPALLMKRPHAFTRRIGRYGLIGFGESYMAGEWDADDLTGVLTIFADGIDDLVPAGLQWLRPVAVARQPRRARNTRDQARSDVAVHYDLSNELFAGFLDETLTYSSALFSRLPAAWPELAEAQRRKIDRLLDAAGVRQDSRVIEIGTGWGELCIRAAERGAYVRSVTLSVEQQQLARRRVAAAGLSERVQIDLCDYRDVKGCYDAALSVEMIEAIGYRAWPNYFQTLERLVKPGGCVAIQAITMPHARMLTTRKTYTWIQKYVFPGGLLPSTRAIEETTRRHTGLRLSSVFSFGPHYAETLRLWRERFTQQRVVLPYDGFDEVFARMWELYLAYSEAGFRSGYLDVDQRTFVRGEPQ